MSAENPSPEEKVGAALKAARTQQGHSLESVCQQTRIARKILESLEAGRFDELPAPVYLHNFLQGYCEHLGLDFDLFWKQLHPPPAPAPAPAETAPAGSMEVHAAASLAHSPYLAALVTSRWGILCGALLAALLVMVMRVPGSRTDLDDGLSPQALRPLRPAVEPNLTVLLRAPAWLSVRTDGELRFEGRAPQNSKQEWKALKAIELRAVPPESLDLRLNGTPYRLPRPGADGVYRIEYP